MVAAHSDLLDFEGKFRLRMERYGNINYKAYGAESINAQGKVVGASHDTLLLQQLIIGWRYMPHKQWESELFFYDARSWGSSLDDDFFMVKTNPNDPYMMHYYEDHHELHRAFVRYKGWQDVSITLGRQQLGYGDRRIFGPGMWGNTIGWLWDALHLSYKREQNFWDLWYGQTRIKVPDDFSLLVRHRYEGVGGYGHYTFSWGTVEPFFAWRHPLYDALQLREDRFWAGVRIVEKKEYIAGALEGFFYDITAVKAQGTVQGTTHDAYAHAIQLGYMQPKKWEVAVRHTYATGDKDPKDNTHQTFDTPFGLIDGMHYGRMDIVTWKNIDAWDVSVTLFPVAKLRLNYALHNLHVAEATDKWYNFGYVNSTGNAYTHIGLEHDMTLGYQATPSWQFLAILGYLDAGDFITGNAISQEDATKLFLQAMLTF